MRDSCSKHGREVFAQAKHLNGTLESLGTSESLHTQLEIELGEREADCSAKARESDKLLGCIRYRIFPKMCNSTDVEESDIIVLSALRGSAAILCAVINTLILASLTVRSDKSRPLHRLVIYVAVSSLLALLANISQTVSLLCFAPWFPPTCTTVSFVNQFTACLLLVLSVWLTGVLVLRYWCPNNRTVLTARKDVAIWAGILVFCGLVAAVPLATEGYGLRQAWCWIKDSRIAERWLLWHCWVVITPGASMVVLIAALTHSRQRLEKYYESSRGINSTILLRNKETAKKINALISFIAAYWTIVTAATVLDQVPHVNNTLPFLVVMAILEPLGIVAVPVVFAVHLHEFRRPSAQNAHSASKPQWDESEMSNFSHSLDTTEKGKGKKKKLAHGDSDKQEQLRESLLLTLEVSEEFRAI